MNAAAESFNFFPVLLCLTGAMLSSLGMILQKIAHKNADHAQSYYTNPKWYAGFVVYCSGDFVLFLTLWYLPQAIVAVLGTWTLVANIFFAVFLLDEKLGRRDLIATTLILSGTTIAVYSYHSDGDQYTASQLWDFLQEESFQGFVLFIVILLVADLVWLVLESTPRRILIRVSRDGVQQRKRSRSISYIFAASIVNTLVMLLGKCVASLGNLAWHQRQSVYLMITSNGGIFVFIFVACGLVCVLNVHLVNKALELGDALVIVPAYFVLGLIFKVTSGIIFFQDYLTMTDPNVASFALGCIVNVVGVYVLSADRVSSSSSRPFNDKDTFDDTNNESTLLNPPKIVEEGGGYVTGSGNYDKEAQQKHTPIKRVNSVSLFGLNVM